MQITAEAAAKYPALKELVDIYSRRQDTTVFWEDKIHKDLTIVEARPNKLIWEFNVQEAHCNQLGNIHGGCVATIIDVCSSFALATWEGKNKWKLIGISTDLTVSFLRGISAGQTARLECDVQRVGKNLASIYTRIYDESGAICYSGSHSKYCIDSRLSKL